MQFIQTTENKKLISRNVFPFNGLANWCEKELAEQLKSAMYALIESLCVESKPYYTIYTL